MAVPILSQERNRTVAIGHRLPWLQTRLRAALGGERGASGGSRTLPAAVSSTAWPTGGWQGREVHGGRGRLGLPAGVSFLAPSPLGGAGQEEEARGAPSADPSQCFAQVRSQAHGEWRPVSGWRPPAWGLTVQLIRASAGTSAPPSALWLRAPRPVAGQPALRDSSWGLDTRRVRPVSMACVSLPLAWPPEAASPGGGALALRFLSLSPPAPLLRRDRKMKKLSVSSASAGRCWQQARGPSSWPAGRTSWSSLSTRVTRRESQPAGESASPAPLPWGGRAGLLPLGPGFLVTCGAATGRKPGCLPSSPGEAPPRGTKDDDRGPFSVSSGRRHLPTLCGILVSTLHPGRRAQQDAVPWPRPPAGDLNLRWPGSKSQALNTKLGRVRLVM